MTKALSFSLLAMLLVTVADSAAIAQQKHPISQSSFELMIQREPLILQGEVTKVEVKLTSAKELWGAGGSAVDVAMTEVTMKIEKVIAGIYGSDEIRIVLPEGKTEEVVSYTAGIAPMKVNVGDHAIVGFKPDSRGTGLNVLDPGSSSFFRVEGTKLIPYREGLYLDVEKPLELLAKKAKGRKELEEQEEREIPELVKASDLICEGTVKQLIDVRSPWKGFVVSIDETLKGKAEKSEVTVDMSDVFFLKTWAPGFRVMLFLKKDSSGYRPVADVNAYYYMHGERLTRWYGTPVRMNISQLKRAIETWKKAEQ